MLRVVLDLGVPREAVLVEDRSRTTFSNVVNSVALLRDLDLLDATRTILLVSCPWHMAAGGAHRPSGVPGAHPAPVLPACGVLHRRILANDSGMPGEGHRGSQIA